MLGYDDKNIYNEIKLLQELFLSSGEKVSALKARLDDKTSNLEKDSARLKSADREAFMADKKLKEMQNEIFLFKWKISKMDDSLNSIDDESKRIDAALNDAVVKKRDIDEATAQIESGMQQTKNAIADIEPQMQEVLSAVEKIVAEKTGLSEEISGLLPKTSIEKEESDADLNNLSLEFARHIGERDRIKGLLAEREEVVGALRDEITAFKEKCSLIKETMELEKKISVLKSDIEKLEEEAGTSGRAANELQMAYYEKEAELNAFSSGNVERKGLIGSLEKEVDPYDELVLKVQNSENKYTESEALVEQALSEMKILFSDNNRILEKLCL